MSSVTVLCPNGRRQVVKTTPNTTLLQVLGEVCTKQKFDRAQYQLKHGRKTLDLSLSLRFTNLPNRAHLELVRGVSHQEGGTVSIALQLPSGDRLQHEFKPLQTLWDVLQHWQTEGKLSLDQGSCPVCVYMRREISSEAMLKMTSLQSLGLSHGKAMIRLHFQESSLQSAPTPVLSSEPATFPKSTDSNESNLPSSTGSSLTAKDSSEHMDVDRSAQATASNNPAPPSSSTAVAPQPACEQEEEVPMEVGKDLGVRLPGSEPLSPVGLSNPASHGTTESMEVSSVNNSVREASPVVSSAETVAHSTETTTQEGNAGEDRQPVATATTISAGQTPAARFESQTSWPETGGHRLGSSIGNVLKAIPTAKPSQLPPEEFQFDAVAYSKSQEPCERHTVLFHLLDGPSTNVLQDALSETLPEEFFTVTTEDLKKTLDDLRSTYAESDLPLMTKALRDRQREAKISSYEQVVVRVQFPDQLVLQAFFRPREPISAVMAMVKDFLADPSIDFYLYVAPPKLVLSPSQSLADAKLIPAAKVFFGCSVPFDHYVKEEHLSSLSTLMDADVITAQALPARRAEKEVRKSTTSVPPSLPPAQSSAQTVENDACPAADTKQPSVPKWFKLGKH